MKCDNRFYLYTGHKFLCTISSTSFTIKKSPLSNFRIVSEQGRTKDLKTQNWQLYKSPERASAVSTNIWGDQPSRRLGSGFIVFGSEAWVPATSLCVWKSISCLLSLIQRSASVSPAPPWFSTESWVVWVVWVDSAWHCSSPHLQHATPAESTVVMVGMAWMHLDSLSTATRMALYPLDSGSSLMLSTEITSQWWVGIRFGVSFPTFCVGKDLQQLQTSHPAA